MVGQHGLRDDVNKLIRQYFDSKEDYRLAAKRAADDGLRAELERTCEQRQHFHTELQNIITRMNVEMSDNGTVGADLKRDWERLRGSVAGGGLESALKLARESEAKSIDHAEWLLKVGIPAELSEPITNHLVVLRDAVARVDELLAQGSSAGA